MINYILEGDIYITINIEIKSKKWKNPLEVFEYLRKFNPAPFGAFLDYEDLKVISASPERFIKMQDKLWNKTYKRNKKKS